MDKKSKFLKLLFFRFLKDNDMFQKFMSDFIHYSPDTFDDFFLAQIKSGRGHSLIISAFLWRGNDVILYSDLSKKWRENFYCNAEGKMIFKYVDSKRNK